MKFPWKCPRPRRLEWSVAAALACTSAVVACGPEFPNSYYAMPESELLAAPEGFFAAEIARLAIAPPAVRAVRVAQSEARTTLLEIEIADVRRRLEENGVGGRAAREIGWRYESARRAVEQRAERVAASAPNQPGATEDDPSATQTLEENLREVPAEFARYLRGAWAWHGGDLVTARREWTALLDLPPAERRQRSTWAAFMLGRAWLKEAESLGYRGDAARREARRAFQQTRRFGLDGLPDALGLGASSLGWEARVALGEEDFATAVALYLEQHAAGDPSAIGSLRITASRLLAAFPADRERWARDAGCRRVMTAYLISKVGQMRYDDTSIREVLKQAEVWAAVLQKSGIAAGWEADRLAWLAYEGGLFAQAAEWVRLAPAESPEANWIRAKLALRGGDVAEGERRLRAALAAPELGQAHRAQVAAELSRVCLARDDYRGALAAYLEGGHWQDAAFVAERVMTTAELIQFVDTQPVRVTPASTAGWLPANPGAALRTLLARRLAREGRPEAAATYFEPEQRTQFDDYVRQVRTGFDITRAPDERGRAFWTAAQIARRHGMELLGTELEPDWSIWGGYFDTGSATEARAQLKLAGGVLAPTAAEMERLKANRAPEKRFHYRYRAAELAWWAASLLPNDADETAEVLTTAGGWLKARDPQAAQPFYQALVIRCGNTALGREAARKRWFPAGK